MDALNWEATPTLNAGDQIGFVAVAAVLFPHAWVVGVYSLLVAAALIGF